MIKFSKCNYGKLDKLAAGWRYSEGGKTASLNSAGREKLGENWEKNWEKQVCKGAVGRVGNLWGVSLNVG